MSATFSIENYGLNVQIKNVFRSNLIVCVQIERLKMIYQYILII